MQIQIERLPKGYFRSGRASITTELPAGYPDPTPAGAIDIKTYPSVRRAEVTGSTSPDIGMNFAFFPLFNHIKRRDIAMTSPVEIDYKNINWNPPEGGGVTPENWTMSFLYRTPDLGPVGNDERDKNIRVVDTQPVTVVSIGRVGPYRFSESRKLMRQIEKWLASNPHWEKAGEPRVFHYNGPEKREADKWSEVQWPVRPAAQREADPDPSKPARQD